MKTWFVGGGRLAYKWLQLVDGVYYKCTITWRIKRHGRNLVINQVPVVVMRGGGRYTATLADPTNSALFMARPKYIITAT